MHCGHASSKLLPLHLKDLMDSGIKEVAEETLQIRSLDLKRHNQVDQAIETIVRHQQVPQSAATKLTRQH